MHEIDVIPWEDHREILADTWDARETPHVSIIGVTGGGKSYLWRNGLLPLLREERVLIIDVKHDDASLADIPNVSRIHKIPHALRRKIRDDAEIYQLLAVNRDQVREALTTAYREGNWTIILDETRAITDKSPGFSLAGETDAIWLRGRSRGVSLVAATQAPRFVPASFYEQASHIYIGPILDKRARRRLQEIGGDSDAIDKYLGLLRRYEYLYVGPLNESGRREMHITKV